MRVVVAILLLCACAPRENATAPPPPQPKPQPAPVVVQTGEFRGVFYVGDESYAFQPCGANESWWIHFSDKARETLRANKISGWGRWPMRVRGTLSPPGHYGHLGGYPRHLHVDEVIATGRPEGC